MLQSHWTPSLFGNVKKDKNLLSFSVTINDFFQMILTTFSDNNSMNYWNWDMQFMLGLAAAARYLYIRRPTFLISDRSMYNMCISVRKSKQ